MQSYGVSNTTIIGGTIEHTDPIKDAVRFFSPDGYNVQHNNTLINMTVIGKTNLLRHSNLTYRNVSFNKSLLSVSTNSRINVTWYLTIEAIDQFSNPLRGAIITINDTFSNVYAGITDVQGVAVFSLTEFIKTQSVQTDFNPYFIQVDMALTCNQGL